MTEEKSAPLREMERRAQELERKIVRFINIDSESFTHSFRGVSITIKAGEFYIGRLPEIDHLATHLARKILSREKKKNTPKDRGVQLFNDQEVQALKEQIISPAGEEQAPENLSAGEARKLDQAKLEKEFNAPKVSTQVVTKKDLIADLESRGIKVENQWTKEELQEKVMEAEAAGIVQKEE